MMTAAVVLVDFQNEYAKPGGKLHDVVAAVMRKNGMIDKVVELVSVARTNGAMVIHSPTVDDAQARGISGTRSTHLGPHGAFHPGQWNSKIVDEVYPKESDIVLKGRTGASALEGTELSFMITEKGIQTVILLGFLSDTTIVETAIELSDSFTDLNVLVCKDGTASTKERHMGAVRKTLPMVGVRVVTCTEALEFVQTGCDSTLSGVGQTISASLSATIAGHTAQPTLGKTFNIFEFQSVLRGAGVFIPSDVLVLVFTRADAKLNNGRTSDCLCSFSLMEISETIQELAGEERDIPMRALKGVTTDAPSVFNFTAGLLLLIGLFPLPDSVNNITGGLLCNVFYLIAIGQSTIGMPVKDIKDMINVENNVRMFKENIRAKARDYESARRASMIGELDLMPNRASALPRHFVEEMQYVEEVIFSGNADALTRSEVEMLLLSELGTNYTSRTLDYVFSLASQTNSHTLGPVEFHHFIASDEDRSKKPLRFYLRHIFFVFTNTMLSLGYLMGLSFFIALCLSIVEWNVEQYTDDLELFAYTWLYFIGTLGFSELAYERIRDAHDLKDRAKALLANCLNYAHFYNRDRKIWREFNKNNCIAASDFPKLLEQSDILLSPSEVTTLIREINADGDNIITKKELETYLQKGRSNRQMRILIDCFQNFSFVANLTWFMGAVGYAMAYYSAGSVNHIANTVGAVGYFLGGSAYALMVHGVKKSDLDCLISLKYATKRILKTASRRFGFGYRRTLVQTMLNIETDVARPTFCRKSLLSPVPESIEYDEESPRLPPSKSYNNYSCRHLLKGIEENSEEKVDPLPPALTNTNWIKHSGKASLPRYSNVLKNPLEMENDHLEDILSCSFASAEGNEATWLEWKSTCCPIAGPLLMYRLASSSERDECAGFIMSSSCCDEEYAARISAKISDDGSKLRIYFPIDCPSGDLSQAEEFDDEINSWLGGIASFKIEADLPLRPKVTASSVIGPPALLNSRVKAGSMLHFKLEERKDV